MAPQKMPKGELPDQEKTLFFRNVEQWLRDNPGKSLSEWRKEVGYTGPALKKRGGVGEIRVSYKGKSAAANVLRQANEVMQRAGQNVYGKGILAPKGSNLEEHHKRVISVYQPFFEGLDNKEKKELAQWFVDEGAPLGHVKQNLKALTSGEHKAIHDWMKTNYIQPTGKPLLNFKDVPLNERLPAAVLYLENVQAAVDEQLKKTLMPSGSALKTLGKAASVLPGVGAVLDVGDVLAGTQQAVTSNSKQQQTTGALRSASGTLGLASLAAPVLAPAALAVSGVSALAERRAAMPKPAQVNQIIPTPKPVMANTPTGVAQLKAMPKSKPLNLVNEAQYFIVNPIRSAYDRIFGKRDI